jgi:hypothetical protein
MPNQLQWRRHIDAWRKSELSQADYCRLHGLNPKTFSTWTRRKLSIAPNAQIDFIPIEVTLSAPVTVTEATLVLRFAGGAQLEFSTAVSPRWLAELLQCQG